MTNVKPLSPRKTDYYLQYGAEEYGPLPQSEVYALLNRWQSQGRDLAEAFVWRSGLQNWVPVALYHNRLESLPDDDLAIFRREQRNSGRFPIPATLWSEGGKLLGNCRNLSMTGVAITGLGEAELGPSQDELVFRLRALKKLGIPDVPFRAQIQWVDDQGFGLFFLEMPEGMRRAIERYLRSVESTLWQHKNAA